MMALPLVLLRFLFDRAYRYSHLFLSSFSENKNFVKQLNSFQFSGDNIQYN